MQRLLRAAKRLTHPLQRVSLRAQLSYHALEGKRGRSEGQAGV